MVTKLQGTSYWMQHVILGHFSTSSSGLTRGSTTTDSLLSATARMGNDKRFLVIIISPSINDKKSRIEKGYHNSNDSEYPKSLRNRMCILEWVCLCEHIAPVMYYGNIFSEKHQEGKSSFYRILNVRSHIKKVQAGPSDDKCNSKVIFLSIKRITD